MSSGDGFSLNIWDAKRLLQPTPFMVITPFKLQFSLIRVEDPIDQERDEWNMAMVNEVFIPVDAKII